MRISFVTIMLLATSLLLGCMQNQKPATDHSEEWYVVLDKNAQAHPFCIVHEGRIIVPATRYKILKGPYNTKAKAELEEKKCDECKDPDTK